MVVGPGDDAAVLPGGVVVSVDTLVEGVHFDERLSAEDVGFKAVAVSVSDMAAMGATPTWMLLSISAPVGFTERDAIAEGVAEAAFKWNVSLIGGDTTRSPGPLVLSVTMAGVASAPVTRTGARPGDHVWVSGFPGLAGAGYLLDDPPAAALTALRRPNPPVGLATALAQAGLVSAMMDLSDGLAVDLVRLARASSVGIRLISARIPIHPAIAEHDPVSLALSGGDDYQLTFTAPVRSVDALHSLAHEHDVVLTRIGTVTDDHVCVLDDRDWPAPAFSHFPDAS